MGPLVSPGTLKHFVSILCNGDEKAEKRTVEGCHRVCEM